MCDLPDVAVGIDSNMARANLGTVTATLTIPAAGATFDTAIIGSAFVLPPARGYLFDISNGGVLNNAGVNTTTLAFLIQTKLQDEQTWQDWFYHLTTNRQAVRDMIGLAQKLAGVYTVSGGQGSVMSSAGANSNLIKNSATSLNGASVVPSLSSAAGFANVLASLRTFRLVAIPRIATPDVGDVITLKVTAIVSQNSTI
jgi:hypothetical protein